MKRITSLIAAVLVLASCQQEPNGRTTRGEKLNLTAEESDHIASGDLIGVNMDYPLSYRNVRTSYSGGKLTPVNPLYWPKAMPDSAVAFRAYFPYDERFNEGGKVVFSVYPDQRNDKDFRASGLFVSETRASVSDPAVVFRFEPKMTKLVLYVRNDTGSEITDVFFSAYPSVTFNMDRNTVKVSGDKAELHAHLSATSKDGVSAYEVIFAPQNTLLSITLSTAGGDYSAVLGSVGQFAEGRQYSNSRLLVLESGHSTPYPFTVSEQDWATSPDFKYKEPLAGGAELAEFTDPGIYKIAKGVATPIKAFVGGLDQTAIVSRNSALSEWRLQNPSTGELLRISTSAAAFTEETSADLSVRSYGIAGLESEFTSKATVVKADGEMVWLVDENEKYGYIITVK